MFGKIAMKRQIGNKITSIKTNSDINNRMEAIFEMRFKPK